ncbi:PadR family transcriptional regulator [Gordonia neofelifaecis]|uniref:Padr family transcriptional regulator n=1 Tax=Gordonia neofelifaecis NRRL B-59395 TaxID=644548 RepID=F1YH51_9ACTN|nr:PadR family transcriptional regulator [Gordonia neofelifaecis]EGD55966.1 padr family transcriptional regulator [Gordonia neofelifaecis NRRL B-59395]
MVGTDAQSAGESYPSLPATSWAVLGMLTLGEQLTGYDLKKWADWSIGYFYWSPSVSQIYAELKKLEKAGFVTSEVVSEPGERGRRVYQITESGTQAVRNWSRDSPVEQPVLKHGLMLRLWMGHLNEPDELKKLVKEHIANLTTLRDQSRLHSENATREASWAYSVMSLDWSSRYFQAEIDLAEDLLAQIDTAAKTFATVENVDELGNPLPEQQGSWREVEDFVEGLGRDKK